eukprot:COSAG01_NODE_73189_length_251_cov_0.486842_1_plen_42_part_10
MGVGHRVGLGVGRIIKNFNCALALYRRVEPSPLPDSWWIKTC